MKLQRVSERLPDGIHSLAELALSEGFRHMDRLILDFESGKNRFDKPGEVLIAVYLHGDIVGVGGINTYAEEARIRRIYVSPAHRRHGVGRLLMQALEECAGQTGFNKLQLRTDTESGARFYESLGYDRVTDEELVTHRKVLT
jgi:GNAT superfamily N-acetyltransferase